MKSPAGDEWTIEVHTRLKGARRMTPYYKLSFVLRPDFVRLCTIMDSAKKLGKGPFKFVELETGIESRRDQRL